MFKRLLIILFIPLIIPIIIILTFLSPIIYIITGRFSISLVGDMIFNDKNYKKCYMSESDYEDD